MHPAYKTTLMLVIRLGLVALCTSRLLEDLTCPTLRHVHLFLNVLDHLSPPRRA
jgi:hypothetical protein